MATPKPEPDPTPATPTARRSGRRTPLQAPPALAGMSRAELLDVAAEAGIVGRHRMRKDELVDALVGHRLAPGQAGR